MKTFQVLSFLTFLLLLSCATSSVEDFVVGDNFIKDRTGIVMIDTLTLTTSTVKYDSVISNSSGRLLVGTNYNEFSGYKSSNSFFQMEFSDAITDTEFVYDSLCLVLNYDKYYFGDTTVNQTISIHRLSEEMELDSTTNYLYTTSNFSYDANPIGTLTFKPQPNSNEEISIRLSDKLGARFTKMIQDENDSLTTQSLFLEVFNGLVIQSEQNVKGAAIGFGTTTASSSESSGETVATEGNSPEFRLYYHLSPNPDDKSDLYYTFSFISSGIYFNQISGNPEGSLTEGISESGNELSSKLTGNAVVVQSGIQFFAKLNIPHVDNLLWMGENSAFVSATLRLFPEKGTYSNSADLPDSLYIYTADRKNQVTGQVFAPGSTSEYVYVTKTIVKEVEETVYYEVDLSTFVANELSEDLVTTRSIMIGYNSTVAKKTADHVIFGGSNSGKYKPVMNVYYYHN
ncbi:MAG: DUF4270 family protein [Prolixibacteraceae bacterium]|jgi:hypothetical protein